MFSGKDPLKTYSRKRRDFVECQPVAPVNGSYHFRVVTIEASVLRNQKIFDVCIQYVLLGTAVLVLQQELDSPVHGISRGHDGAAQREYGCNGVSFHIHIWTFSRRNVRRFSHYEARSSRTGRNVRRSCALRKRRESTRV